MSDFGPQARRGAGALPDPVQADNVVYNPTRDQLRSFSHHLETTTEYGSPSYVSEQRSRCADRTRNAVDDEFDAADHRRLDEAFAAVLEREMVCIDRRMGRHPEHSYRCRYYVPKEYARIALSVANLFEPAEGPGEPDFLTVQLPDRTDVAIRVLPEAGVTAVVGSDYTGEAKKSFLRLFMYHAKRAGGLGLHAGSKRVTLERPRDGPSGAGPAGDEPDLETVGQLFLGLSATGKSTLTAHGLWLEEPESATMLQDDVCALLPDGSVAGSEANGLYVKTIGLDETDQPAMYEAATHESAVLENVDVAPDGTVDFDSDRYTTNGRAAVLRDHLSSAGEDIDLDEVDHVFFITRNPCMPPVARLTSTQAAAAFMLGESIQTSAGDPSKAGESVRVVGTNPFIIGSEGEEGNRFRELIERLDVDCFVLNTGHLGDHSKDVGVEDSVTILREIARGTVEWTDDETTGLTVPASVPGMEIDEFALQDHVEDCERLLRELRAERREYLDSFDDLDDAIRRAVY